MLQSFHYFGLNLPKVFKSLDYNTAKKFAVHIQIHYSNNKLPLPVYFSAT